MADPMNEQTPNVDGADPGRLLFAGGRVDITPDVPLQLAGHGTRWKPFNRVEDPLEANAIVLRSEAAKVVFLQVDVLSVGVDCRRRILAGLGGRLREEELFLVASHTHSAPNIDDRLPEMAHVDPGYVARTVERICGMLDAAISAAGRPVDLCCGEAQTAHVVNRRKWCLTPVWCLPPVKRVMARHPNPKGPRDDTLRVFGLTAREGGGELAGALWNFACHPVTMADRRVVSADYPGGVRRALRRRAGGEIPVVFLPGFAGDVRPNRVARWPRSLYYLLHRIINGPVFADFTPDARRRWVASLSDAALAALSSARPRHISRIRSRRLVRPFRLFLDGLTNDRPISLHAVSLGDDLTVVGVSGELVIEYAALLRQFFSGEIVAAVGYMDGVCGYIPISEMIADGGMEVTSPGYSFGKAKYRDTIAAEMMDAFRSLAEADRNPGSGEAS